MDRYVLDANALFEDFRFERNPGRLLLREARHRRIRLLVPQVVIDETVNLFREAVQEQVRVARRALRRLQGMKAIDATRASLTVNVDAVVAEYAGELMAIFLNVGAEELSYPSTSHEAVVARALKRHKPFDGNGQDGYRDVLLWETYWLPHRAEDGARSWAWQGRHRPQNFTGGPERCRCGGLFDVPATMYRIITRRGKLVHHPAD